MYNPFKFPRKVKCNERQYVIIYTWRIWEIKKGKGFEEIRTC